MLTIQTLQRRPVRIAVIAGFSVLCLAWLFGPELMLSAASVQGELTSSAKLEFRAWKMVAFVAGNGVLLYYLLGRIHTGTAGQSHVTRLANRLTIGAAYADENGIICFANPSFLRLFDLSPSIFGQVALQDLLREHGEAPPGGLLPATGKLEIQMRSRMASGRKLDLVMTVQADTGASPGFVITVNDVSEVRRLRSGHDLTANALNALPYGLAICDLTTSGFPIAYANTTIARFSGYSVPDLLGAPWRLVQGADGAQLGVAQLRTAMEQGEPALVSLRHLRKDGASMLSEVELTPVTDRNGMVTHAVCLVREMTSKSGLLGAAGHNLWYDEVTLLLSRAGLTHTLQEMLSVSSGERVLLLKTDIRNFHEFNTAAGWDAGDALLTEVGRRLSRALPGAAVGRTAADQYALAVPIDPLQLETSVALVRHAIDGRYMIPGVSCDPLIAIGYTICEPGVAARTALQQSSVALKEACREGMGGTRRFDEQMQRDILDRRRLTIELQRAVQERDFVVEFLPEVDLASGQIVAAEALVRWSHPLFGVQQPSNFIRLAEQTGLIIEIGDIVLRQAAAFATRLNGAGRRPTVVTINLSVAELRRPDIAASIEASLRESGADPSWLQLDLVENTIATATDETLASLDRLHRLGVGLTIDDFGAGHSPLNYLARLPISKIKVSPWFTRDVEHAGVTRSVLKAILEFGAVQNACVVAKGIETEVERQSLMDLGCTRGQGFLFSHPLDADEFEHLLTSHADLSNRQTVPSSSLSS